MKKIHDITKIRFEEEYIIITVDSKLLKFQLSEISEKLVNASNIERETFKISPSGYGIHWEMLDEDLSIDGLFKTFLAKSTLQIQI